MAALGVLCALALSLRTARTAGLNPGPIWNLCIVALFAALVGSRIVLIIANWSMVRSHPAWMLGIAMVHHPLLAVVAAFFAGTAGLIYARTKRMPLRATADVLAAPIALGFAFEQIGALLAGSGYGAETTLPWAVVFTSPLAARWSGAPLGVPLHPVQAYAAMAFLAIAAGLLIAMPKLAQHGDAAGAFLMAVGAAIYFTEFWRDPEGRGAILEGFLDGPQIGSLALLLVGAWMLRRHDAARIQIKANPIQIEAPLPSEQAGENRA